MNKKGYAFRVISGMIGACLFLVALFFLDKEEFLYAIISGFAGVLLITVSMFPMINSKI